VGSKRTAVSAAKVDVNDGPPRLIWFPEYAIKSQCEVPDDAIQHAPQKHAHGKSAARKISERMRTEKEKDDDDDHDDLPMRPQRQAIRRFFERREAKSSSQSHSVAHRIAPSILLLDDDAPSSTSSGSNFQGFIDDQQNQSFLHSQRYQQQQIQATPATMPQSQDTELRQSESVSFQKIISTSKFQGQITKQAISSEQRFLIVPLKPIHLICFQNGRLRHFDCNTRGPSMDQTTATRTFGTSANNFDAIWPNISSNRSHVQFYAILSHVSQRSDRMGRGLCIGSDGVVINNLL
jgi:hypothetical protein